MSIEGSRLPGAVIGMSRPAPKFKRGDIVSLASPSGNRLVGKIFIIDWRGYSEAYKGYVVPKFSRSRYSFLVRQSPIIPITTRKISHNAVMVSVSIGDSFQEGLEQ